jgi:hypothetical protein
MEGGVLGCASLQKFCLELRLMEGGIDGTVKWVMHRVVKLDNLPPFRYSYLISSAEDVGVISFRQILEPSQLSLIQAESRIRKKHHQDPISTVLDFSCHVYMGMTQTESNS